jgi:hypothetical protein
MQRVCGLLFLCASLGCANTLFDTFGQSQSGCTKLATYPYSTCDVIGDEADYDIQMVSMSIVGGTATVNLYFNTAAPVEGSGSNMYFGSFTDVGLSLIVGDLFFYNPNTPYDPSSTAPANIANLEYAVPLGPHDSLTAGDLYQVTSAETAQTALNNTGVWIRPSVTVLTTAGTLAATGAETISSYGNGTNSGSNPGALYNVQLVFSAADLSSLIVNDQIGLLFSSADCANDLILGDLTVEGDTAPEPASLSLMAGGLGLLLAAAARRRAARPSRAA